MADPGKYGVVAFDADGKPIPEAERQQMADDEEKRQRQAAIDEYGEKAPDFFGGGYDSEVVKDFASPLLKPLGSIALILMGVVFLVLAFLVTDAGKKAATMAVTKGAV